MSENDIADILRELGRREARERQVISDAQGLIAE